LAYTKNYDPWTSGDLVTASVLDNFETIYTEVSSYLSSHVHDDLYQTQAEMQAAYWYSGNCGSESGADADFLYKSTGNLHAVSFAGLGVPTGLAVLWYGSVASIPAGWHICDGTEGTIDLRGKFPVGAGTGSAYSVGDTSGSATFAAAGTVNVATHAITIAEMAAHTHKYSDTRPTAYNNADPGATLALRAISGTSVGSTGSGTAHGHSAAEGTSFTGDAVASLPFCIALCYIQKI
jgi:microcystin-dependent protein